MEARATKASKVSARFSKSLAKRRLRPNQEKTRSITSGAAGPTKPFLSSLGLTISMRSRSTLVPPLQLATRYSGDRPKSFHPDRDRIAAAHHAVADLSAIIAT
jgi:hypothetical protein